MTDIYVCVCACVCLHMAMFGLLTSSFLVPVSPLLLFLRLLLPQGSRQEVGSRSEAIVKGKPLASSCYERKCIQMCFLCVRPLFSPPSFPSSFSHPCGRDSASLPSFLSLCFSWVFLSMCARSNAASGEEIIKFLYISLN